MVAHEAHEVREVRCPHRDSREQLQQGHDVIQQEVCHGLEEREVEPVRAWVQYPRNVRYRRSGLWVGSVMAS